MCGVRLLIGSKDIWEGNINVKIVNGVDNIVSMCLMSKYFYVFGNY